MITSCCIIHPTDGGLLHDDPSQCALDSAEIVVAVCDNLLDVWLMVVTTVPVFAERGRQNQ